MESATFNDTISLYYHHFISFYFSNKMSKNCVKIEKFTGTTSMLSCLLALHYSKNCQGSQENCKIYLMNYDSEFSITCMCDINNLARVVRRATILLIYSGSRKYVYFQEKSIWCSCTSELQQI